MMQFSSHSLENIETHISALMTLTQQNALFSTGSYPQLRLAGSLKSLNISVSSNHHPQFSFFKQTNFSQFLKLEKLAFCCVSTTLSQFHFSTLTIQTQIFLQPTHHIFITISEFGNESVSFYLNYHSSWIQLGLKTVFHTAHLHKLGLALLSKLG